MKAPNVATATRKTLRDLAPLVQMMRQLLNTNDFGLLSLIDPIFIPKACAVRITAVAKQSFIWSTYRQHTCEYYAGGRIRQLNLHS